MTQQTRAATMSAVVQERYGDVDVLEVREVGRPEIGAGEVLVRVHTAGVDAGVWHLTTGLPRLVRLMGYGLRAPKDPGRGTDLAGRVVAGGAEVTGFAVGDEVFGAGAGAFAEYARVREDRCEPIPAGLSFEEAAVVPTSAMTALQALRDKGRVQPGQHVMVIGAGGGVGTFAVQLAKAFGAEVTGVASTAKLDLVRSVGADHVIDYTREDLVDGSRRYDLILDCAGNRPLSTLRRALTPDGTLVIVGGEDGGRWFGGTGRLLRAALLTPFVGQRLLGFMAAHRQEDLRVLAELIEAGQVRPVVDRVFPLAELPDAVRRQHRGEARGKFVVVP
jgi:NADPH:quinone reductase-like Zn-dependent oxidoreductase